MLNLLQTLAAAAGPETGDTGPAIYIVAGISGVLLIGFVIFMVVSKAKNK